MGIHCCLSLQRKRKVGGITMTEPLSSPLQDIIEELKSMEWLAAFGVIGTTNGAIGCFEKDETVLRLRKMYQDNAGKTLKATHFRLEFGTTLDTLVHSEFQPGFHFPYDMTLGAIAVALRNEYDLFADDYLMSLSKLGNEFNLVAMIADKILEDRGVTKPTKLNLSRSFNVRIQGPKAAEFNRVALEKNWIASSGGGSPTFRDLSIWEECLPEVEMWIDEQGDSIEAVEVVRNIDEPPVE